MDFKNFKGLSFFLRKATIIFIEKRRSTCKRRVTEIKTKPKMYTIIKNIWQMPKQSIHPAQPAHPSAPVLKIKDSMQHPNLKSNRPLQVIRKQTHQQSPVLRYALNASKKAYPSVCLTGGLSVPETTNYQRPESIIRVSRRCLHGEGGRWIGGRA